MLKTRIAPALALALAATVAFGTTGCGFFVSQATHEEYAPSDGIDVDLPGVNVRNLLVVAGESQANIVFTGVNNGTDPVRLTIQFVEDGASLASQSFTVEPGTTPFGVDEPELIDATLLPGSMVTAFLESSGTEIEREVPVVDGTLDEYAPLVP